MTEISFKQNKHSDKQLLQLYKQLLYPRLIEEKMLNLLRQGRISKWFSGIGQEAISVGVTCALSPDDWIFPLHRNLGVFTVREFPLDRLFAQWQGKKSGYTKGRDRSFHFGFPEKKVVGMISHLGPQLALADGAALASLLQKKQAIAVAFTGEGGTSEGDFHEALNVAAVWKLPVLFVVENNGYGLSTPTHEQYACKSLVDRAIGYGMEGYKIDGNNILEVEETVRSIVKKMRKNPAPVLLECMSFRMRGHEEASGVKYVPKELLEQWAKKDPISNYERWLMEKSLLSVDEKERIYGDYRQHIQEQVESVFAWEEGDVDEQEELSDMYASFAFNEQAPSINAPTKSLRMIDAIKDGLKLAMQHHPQLVLMGQDIAEYGGVFKITEGFVDQFGKDRVRNTPICESAIVGAGLGLSLCGMKAMIEMQFADFVSCGFNQIVNNLAKLHYRWAQNADLVIRMPAGAATQAGPFHSQSNEAWFTHVPGLKIVYPSNPYDAKGLLLTSFEDPNPVLFFEHKALYRGIEALVPEGYYNIPFGKAATLRQGNACCIISYGLGVQWAMSLVNEINLDAEILDLRTLVPLDYESIDNAVKKTNRVLILHEDTLFGGIGGEIAAYISEHLFQHLDAPVMRCAGLDTAIPFAKRIEDLFLAKHRLKQKLEELISY